MTYFFQLALPLYAFIKIIRPAMLITQDSVAPEFFSIFDLILSNGARNQLLNKVCMPIKISGGRTMMKL